MAEKNNELESWQGDVSRAGLPSWTDDMLGDMPEGKCDWEVFLEKHPDGSVKALHIVIRSKDKKIYRAAGLRWIGTAEKGYAALYYRELEGGGPLLSLVAQAPGGQIYAGLLMSERFATGPNSEFTSGGTYKLPDKEHVESGIEAARDEVAGCIGTDTEGCPVSQVVEVPAVRLNANRGFVLANPGLNEGVSTLVGMVPWEYLKPCGDGTFEFPGEFNVTDQMPGVHGARYARFFPIEAAMMFGGCALTVAALGRIKLWLENPQVFAQVEQYRKIMRPPTE